MVRRKLGPVSIVSIAVVAVVGLPGRASADASPPPSYTTVGTPYSFQISDPAHGTPVQAWASAGPSGDCGPDGSAYGLPTGLSMSPTGLISGTPSMIEQASTCGDFIFADGTREEIPLTITVGTGNPTLDATAVPAGTSIARNLEDSLSPCDPRYPGCLLIAGLFPVTDALRHLGVVL